MAAFASLVVLFLGVLVFVVVSSASSNSTHRRDDSLLPLLSLFSRLLPLATSEWCLVHRSLFLSIFFFYLWVVVVMHRQTTVHGRSPTMPKLNHPNTTRTAGQFFLLIVSK